MNTPQKKSKWITGILAAAAILSIGYFVFFSSTSKVFNAARDPTTAEQTETEPIRPPVMGMMGGVGSNAPAEDNSKQQAKIEAARKAMEPKFQALMEAMQPIMQGGQEPGPGIQRVGGLMMQAMQFSQSVQMLGITNGPRAQKRLESGLAILQDLLDEAYEEAQKAGLINDHRREEGLENKNNL